MKGFTRTKTSLSLCGLNCALCSMHLGGYCPGCGGGAGNQSCTIAKCSLEHGSVPFCWECPEYPCPRYDGFDTYDSFIPRRGRTQDIARARAMGLEQYLAHLPLVPMLLFICFGAVIVLAAYAAAAKRITGGDMVEILRDETMM